jgi:hypothetical protein
MKKIINTVQILAMLALIPAVIMAYLHDNEGSKEQTVKTTVVSPKANVLEVGSLFNLVRNY